MIAIVSLAVSVLAFATSALTAWLTLFRRGTVLMTQPTVIFFGYDGGPAKDGKPGLKVYLRTLLYSTAKGGRIVESMYICLRRGETRQNFNVWVYGESRLSRGSGLFVPETGFSANHHFLLPEDGATYNFVTGRYHLDIYATLVGEKSAHRLYTIALNVTALHADALKGPGQGLYFDWSPEISEFNAHIRPQPEAKMRPLFDAMFGDPDEA